MTDFPTLPLAPTLAWKRHPFREKPPRIDHYKEHPRGLRKRRGITGETLLRFTWCRVRVCASESASDPTSSSSRLLLAKKTPVLPRCPSGLPPQGTRWRLAFHEIMKKHSCFRGFVNAVFKNTLLSYVTCLQVNPFYPFCPLREQIVTDSCV